MKKPKRKAFRSPGIDGERLLAEAQAKVKAERRKRSRIGPPHPAWGLPKAERAKVSRADLQRMKRVDPNLRQVPIADLKELHWWREHFATRFVGGSLPRPGTGLVGKHLVLFEDIGGGRLIALDDSVKARVETALDTKAIAVSLGAVEEDLKHAHIQLNSARADSQRSLQLAAQARRQVTSAADFAEMLMNHLAGIAEQLPAHDQVDGVKA